VKSALIHATGIGLPDRVLPNQYFDDLLGEPVSEWLENNVEIYERRWCAENQQISDLCKDAATDALTSANLHPEAIDLLIVATDTPEYISPATASKVQHLCGMNNAGAFDINSACAGFVTALITAANFIAADERYKHIMVIGAYKMSPYLNKQDKKTVTLFADGAAAVILKSVDNPECGRLASSIISAGEYYNYMGIYGGGSKYPCSADAPFDSKYNLQFVKKFPSDLNVNMWTKLAVELCSNANLRPDEIDHFFFTQININSIRETMQKLNVDQSKAHTAMHQYGYTGSACIPMALHQAHKSQKLSRGQTLLFIGSGGGLAFSGALFKI